MIQQRIEIAGIPAIIWGGESDKVWLCVHGKMSSKEEFSRFAAIAARKGYQVLSFDLPQHGERINEEARCDIWNGVHDLSVVGTYAFEKWKDVSLYGCSLGAYFSLHAYQNQTFSKCLFQSPILDMEYLIRQMMLWFDVSQARLAREQEIDTPIDPLRWDYYQYVLTHPIVKWDSPTSILFGGRDNLQTLGIVNRFAAQFGCTVTVSEHSEHPFMAPKDGAIVSKWLSDNI